MSCTENIQGRQTRSYCQPADVKETSVQAAVAADLPKIGGIFANEEEQRTALETFLCE